MKQGLIILLFLISICGFSQSVNVIPLPQEVVMRDGVFKMGSANFKGIILCSFPLSNEPDTFFNFLYLEAKFLSGDYSLSKVNSIKKPFCSKTLILQLLSSYNTIIGLEGYHITIDKDSIVLSANTNEGIYRGVISIDQMIVADSGRSLPCCDITDYPSYSYRAMHLDVCRHFFSKDFIKKYIDQLAYYKINTFHWHLTDDQGWRIEIKKYPKLTEVGAWRMEKDGTKYGGYYTQDDIREIVAYANERYITIIPEIEMPGHSVAALAAYPHLGCTGEPLTVPNTWGIKKDIYAPTDTVFRFFEDVMDEVCALFPGRYIHIGGDEAPKAQWKNSPIAQTVMKQNNLKDEEELQHYFMHRVEKYLNSKGKTAIGWGEVVKGGLSDSIVVMSWLSKGAGIKAAKHGNNVIMAPRGYCYFDYPQQGDKLKAFWMLPLPIRKVYSFSPAVHGLSAAAQSHILGGEATLWTEYVDSESEVWHQMWPRVSALAEALWTRSARRDFADFKLRLDKIKRSGNFNK